MSIISKLFSNKEKAEKKVGGMEDFMYLIRVYYQSVMATRMGITSLQALPDLRLFKQTLHIPTINNRLGQGEKSKCQKMMTEIYHLPDSFFKEIDNSIKTNCSKPNDARDYLFMFQGFTQELLMVVSNTMQWKLRIPNFFKNTLKKVIAQGIEDIFTKDNWKDAAVRKSVYSLRTYQKRLSYSTEWMTIFVFHVILLAKKEPKPKDVDEKK